MVPPFSSPTVAPVAGGLPVTVVTGCGLDSMYGVIVYLVTGPPLDGALHVRLADPRPAVALTFVTWPGAVTGVGSKLTSTQ